MQQSPCLFDLDVYRRDRHNRAILRLCALLYLTNQVLSLSLRLSPVSFRLLGLAVFHWIARERSNTAAPRSTQPSIPPGLVNMYQLRLERQRRVWLIPLAVLFLDYACYT